MLFGIRGCLYFSFYYLFSQSVGLFHVVYNSIYRLIQVSCTTAYYYSIIFLNSAILGESSSLRVNKYSHSSSFPHWVSLPRLEHGCIIEFNNGQAWISLMALIFLESCEYKLEYLKPYLTVIRQSVSDRSVALNACEAFVQWIFTTIQAILLLSNPLLLTPFCASVWQVLGKLGTDPTTLQRR